MAGQARRGTRGQGRSSRADSSWPVLAVASAAGSGSDTATSVTSPTTPLTTHSTRATYRHLLLKGMEPEEAANLTAFIAGIPVGEAHWTLKQINQLLFLRRMAETGKFGGHDGKPH